MLKIFGHKAPDTDATGSAIIWAWALSDQGQEAQPFVLGTPNTEAAFVLQRWGFETPDLLETVTDTDEVVIVDTNNPAELPDNVSNAHIRQIIDHHLLVGGITTREPIEITIKPLASTATIMAQMLDSEGRLDSAPEGIKGLILSCVLSDTLEFRSPTTTAYDQELAARLAKDLGVDINSYASEMFAAKSDVSHMTDAELLRLDSKKYEVGGTNFRVSVLETTSPAALIARKTSLINSMPAVAQEDGVDQVLLFIVDILNEEATLLVANEMVASVAEKSFGQTPTGDSVVLPGVMSRKKQIIPNLKV
ncbi:manganese-dependent inorganic pyrophosphatase [Amylibacter marinus]|uniref:Manganese-dependent inorganic pyrophosphatase n=1 Tax=Amylibacter marinus TaxID=1475483 RepID=A0ABQ5VTL0_9RHOB|nr:manganese-dependent inorganic pyrophosphatase [Amylibacter marinus]GLQ34502.1 manganese-dependent inorganic pyrophosphatase [Amylibacter marinus]